MAVVRAAVEMLRGDIREQSSLQGVPTRGAKHDYAAEAEMKVAPPLQALQALPPSLVGLLQSVTDLRMPPEISGAEIGRVGLSG